MTLSQFRVFVAAQFVALIPMKRALYDEEIKQAFARVDQLMAAGGYEGSSKPQQGQLDDQTRQEILQRVAKEKEDAECRAKMMPIAAAITADVALARQAEHPALQLVAEIPPIAQLPVNEPVCKACNDTKRNSKGGQCICVEHPVKPIPPAPAEEPPVIQYLTKEYVCESCSNANMLISLAGREPQTAAYNCNECGFVGEVVFESEGDINDLIATAEKIEPHPVHIPTVSSEQPKKRGRKPKNTIEETAPLLEAALAQPTGLPVSSPTLPIQAAPARQAEPIVSEPARHAQPLPATPAFKAPPLPPVKTANGNVSPPHNVKPSAEIAAAVASTEQQPVGAVAVQIAEVPEINSEAAAAGLASIFDAYPDDKIIKEWELITKKVFDPSKGCTIAAARAELVQRMAGVVAGF